jgi:hypothetical protein
MRLAHAALALACLLAVPAVAQEAGTLVERSPHISVPVRLTEEVKPDLAILSLAVQAERRTAAEAAAETAKAGQAVIAELKAQGVEERDARTRDLAIVPLYRNELDANGRPTGRRTVTGYRARSSLQVRIRDVAKAGRIARDLVDKGANVFEGIAFDLADRDGVTDSLRVRAFAKAAERARAYVQPLGVKLGRVLVVQADQNSRGPERPAVMMARAAVADEAAPPPPALPVEPGVIVLEANVVVTWEVKE